MWSCFSDSGQRSVKSAENASEFPLQHRHAHTYVRTHTHNWESVFPPLFRWWFEFVTFRLIAARFLLCFSFIHSSFSINLRIHNLNNFPSRTQTHAHTHRDTGKRRERDSTYGHWTLRLKWDFWLLWTLRISSAFTYAVVEQQLSTESASGVLDLPLEKETAFAARTERLRERERARERAASARKREPILSYTIWCWLMPYSDSASGRANVASEPVLTLWHGFPTTTDRTAENHENSGECSALETNAV